MTEGDRNYIQEVIGQVETISGQGTQPNSQETQWQEGRGEMLLQNKKAHDKTGLN